MKKEIISFLKPRLALLLAVAMLISMLPVSAFAAESTAPESTWESQVTGSFTEAASTLESYTHYSVVDGEAVPETVTIDTTATLGSKENPIAISSPEELILFGQAAANGDSYTAASNPTYGKYYILTQDSYDMGGHSMLALSASAFFPSGDVSYFGFYGTLIGNGATIRNAYIVAGTRVMNGSNKTIQPALFSALNGRIWDLTMEGCTVSGGSGGMGMLYAATNGLTEDAIINCNIVDGQLLPGSGISTINLLGSPSVNSQADVTLGCDYTLRSNLTLNSGETLTIPEGVTLTVPAGRTLTLFDGDSLVNNGTIVKEGTITCGAHNVDETTGICALCGNTFVARVGQTYYATVSAAVNAANSSKGTVTVFKDAAVTSFVTTYSSDVKIEVVDGATVTVADGGTLMLTWRTNGIDGVVSEAEGYVAASSSSNGYAYSSLNDLMANCNFGYTVRATVNSDASISRAISMDNSSELTIPQGVTVTLNKPLTLRSGTSLINNGKLVLAEGGSIVNNGGTATCGESSGHAYLEGVCQICGNECAHTGDATCAEQVTCPLCGEAYQPAHTPNEAGDACAVCGVTMYRVSKYEEDDRLRFLLFQGPDYAFEGQDYVGRIIVDPDYGVTMSTNFNFEVWVDGVQITEYHFYNTVLTVPAHLVTGDILITCDGDLQKEPDTPLGSCPGIVGGSLSHDGFVWAADYSSCTIRACCGLCDEIFEYTHTPGVTTTAATCTQTGKAVYSVSFRDLSDSQEVILPIDESNHDYVDGVCSRCGEKLYPIFLSGVQISDDNASDILGDGTASYDAATGTLTLNGATVDASALDVPALQITGGTLTLALQGTNALIGSVQVQSSTDEEGNTTWYGEPAISIAEGAALIITGDETATLTLMGNDFAYTANDHIPSASSISGGSLTVAGGTITTNNGIRLTGDYSQTGGSVEAGFLEAQNVTVSDGILNTKAYSGIYPRYADSLAGSIHGIFVNKAINISGGTVSTASGSVGHNGDYCGETRVTGETITTHGLYALESVSITGGTVTSTGCVGGYVIDPFGFLGLGQYTEDDVTPRGPAPGSALEAPNWSISEEATFICGSETSHRGGTATCTELAVCHFCGEGYGVVDAANHVYGDNGICSCGQSFQGAVLNDDGIYEIGNAGQLIWFARFVNLGNKGVDAVLTADIDMSGIAWTPICSTALYYSANPAADGDWGYTGTFDGQGHVISNLSLTGSATETLSYGLFGTVSGTVKNLGMKNFSFVDGGKDCRAGSIVGQLLGGTITDCYAVDCTLDVTEGTSGYIAGGLAGCNYAGTIENCFVMNCTVKGHSRCAALVADCRGDASTSDRPGTVKNCYSDSTLTGSQKVASYITDCESYVTATRFSGGEIAIALGDAWGQTIGTDEHPVVGGPAVYENTCGDGFFYANDDTDHDEHAMDGITCSLCGNYQAAVLITEDNYATLGVDASHVGAYAISNVSQLYWYAALTNGMLSGVPMDYYASGVLLADLDLEGRDWIPIGLYEETIDGMYLSTCWGSDNVWDDVNQRYTTYFDGRGHTISNFNAVGENSQGLFGYIYCASIMNLMVKNATASGWNAGAIAGYPYECLIINCSAINCTISGETASAETADYAGSRVGSLAGGTSGYFYNCMAWDCEVLGYTAEDYLYALGGPEYNGNSYNCAFSNVFATAAGEETATELDYGWWASPEDMASGYIAYWLSQGYSDEYITASGQIWGQTLGTDACPVLGGPAVYQVLDCDGVTETFSNTNENKSHSYNEYGWCTVCEAECDHTPDEITGNCAICGNFIIAKGVVAMQCQEGEQSESGYEDGYRSGIRYFVDINEALNYGCSDLYLYGNAHYSGEFTLTDATHMTNPWVKLYLNGHTLTLAEGLGVYVGYDWEIIDGTLTGSYDGALLRPYLGTYELTLNGVTLVNEQGYALSVGNEYGGSWKITLQGGSVLRGAVADVHYSGAEQGSLIFGDSYTGEPISFALAEGVTAENFILATAAEGVTLDRSWMADNDTTDELYVLRDAENNQLYLGACVEATHEWDWAQLETTHERTCSICGLYESADHADEVADHFCDICGKQLSDHEVQTEVEWYLREDSCYVNLTASCPGCDITVYDSGDAALTGSYEGTNCQNPSTVTYSFTYTFDGTEYTVTETFKTGTDPHTVFDGNGFCTSCGGYQKPTVDPGEDPEWDYDDVYLIYNAGQLFWFANHVNNVNNGITGKLMTNIDLNPGYTFNADGTYTGGEAPRMWTPIGSGYPCYAGNFDGNGFTVSGAYAVSEGSYVGLFGNTDYNYEIKNLGITNSYFEGSDHVGGLAGYAYTYINNCYVTNTVYVVGESSTAGLVGYNGVEISNSYAMAGTLVDGGWGSCYNCYYLADEDTDGYDGTTALTAEDFASGKAAYLLQSGIQSEDVYDEEGTYVETVIPQIWGQTLGEDAYPVVFGDQVNYGYTTCAASQTQPSYTNEAATESKPDHSWDGDCDTACGSCGDQRTETADHTYANDCDPDCDVCGATREVGDHVYSCGICDSTCDTCGEEREVTYDYDANGFCNGCGGYQSAVLNADGEYEIGNAGQLYWFAALVNTGVTEGETVTYPNVGANAVLTDDITIPEGMSWTPIGSVLNERYFVINHYTGSFDGQEHTISGLYIGEEDQLRYAALFGYTNGARIANLTVADSSINGLVRAGAIAVYATGGSIINCHGLNNTVTSTDRSAGGIVQTGDNILIRLCTSSGTVTAQNAGGIASYLGNGSTVEYCMSSASVSGYDSETGGIVGSPSEGCKLHSCLYIGTEVTSGYGIHGVRYSDDNPTGTTNCWMSADLVGAQLSQDMNGNVGTNCGVLNPGALESGEAAWILQQYQQENIWGQTVGVDPHPVFSGVTVYRTYVGGNTLEGVRYEYANTPGTPVSQHSYNENGLCDCGCYQAAEAVDGVYQINNLGNLYWFAALVNGSLMDGTAQNTAANAVLNTDILINENVLNADGTLNTEASLRNWVTMYVYSGSFDGQGHTISGLYCVAPMFDAAKGLFCGFIGRNIGTVSNLLIEDAYVTVPTGTVGRGQATILAGSNFGTIINCGVVGTVLSKGYADLLPPGGKLYNCFAIGTVYKGENVNSVLGGSTTKAYNCYYQADSETDSLEGTTALTAEQFASGEAAYLLSQGYTLTTETTDSETGETVTTETFYDGSIWGQTIGEDAYPVPGGPKVYQITNCKDEILYSNIDENIDHVWVEPTCTAPKTCDLCGETEGEALPHVMDSITGLCVNGCEQYLAVAQTSIAGEIHLYETLDAAIQAVKDCTADSAAKVTLLQSIALGNSYQTIASGVFTLDLNGFELSSTSTSRGVLYLAGSDATELTLVDSGSTGKLTGGQYGVYVYDGTLTVTGGTISGIYAVYSWLSNVYILGGTLQGETYDFYPVQGESVLGVGPDGIGATFPDGIHVSYKTLNELLAEGAAYWAGDTMVVPFDEDEEISGRGDIVIKAACSHSTGTASYVDQGQYHFLHWSCCSADIRQAHTVDQATGKCTVCQGLASVLVTVSGSQTYYGTFAEAIEAVADCTQQDNAEIRLLRDNVLGNSYQYVTSGVFTLDLNGFELSNTYSNRPPLYLKGENAVVDVTIADSGTTGKIIGYHSAVSIYSSKLTVTGGTITNESVHSVVYANDGSELLITGGTFTGYSGLSCSDTQATITGGTFTVNGMNAVSSGSGSVFNISGGTFSNSGGTTVSGSSSEINISGGTFSSGYDALRISNVKLTITGGTFSGDCGVYAYNNTTARITGGSFECNEDLYTNSAVIKLSVNENGMGATFVDGVQFKGSLTLNDAVVTGVRYWAGETLLTVEDGAAAITDQGDITVKAICDHADNENVEDGICDTPFVCSVCGFVITETKAHVFEYQINDDGTHTGTCSICGTVVTEAHSYSNLVCACGLASEEAVAVLWKNGIPVAGYTTLDAAVAEAENAKRKDAAVVKLVKSVDLGSSYQDIGEGVFTLDLNGMTLSSTNSVGTLYISIYSEGDFTITDTAGGGRIVNTGPWDCAIKIYRGTVNIDSGTMADIYLSEGTLNVYENAVISGGDYGVDVYDGIVNIYGGTISNTSTASIYGAVSVYSGQVNIYGGTISGAKNDIAFDDSTTGTVVLGIGDNGVGATFPGGITVYRTTLNAILGSGSAYWQGNKQITPADNATAITGGDVVIKAPCTHENVTVIYTDNGDNHSCTWSCCGFTYTEGHNYDDGVLTDPTCTEVGGMVYTCTVCGNRYAENEIPATGHSYGDDSVCDTCGHDVGRVLNINMTDSYGDGWNGNAIQIYEDGELVGTATIEAGENATWTGEYDPDKTYQFYWVKGSFSRECSFEIQLATNVVLTAGESDCSGYTDGQLLYCTHTEETIPSTAPTCTETGLSDGVKCSLCGEILVAQEVIPALGHSEPVYTNNGDTHSLDYPCCDALDVTGEGHTFGDNFYCVCGAACPDGIFETSNGDLYYVENGYAVQNKGLVKTTDADGHIHYYYFGCGIEGCSAGDACQGEYKAQKSNRHYAAITNGYLVEGGYTTDKYGVIEHIDDTSVNGIYEIDGVKYCLMDGVKVAKGLFEQDGKFYYARSSGALVVGQNYWVSKTNGLTYKGEAITAGTYTFDAEGAIVFPEEKNGFYFENGGWYYYVDNQLNYAGLIYCDGPEGNDPGYYYVNSSCKLVTNCAYWISKNNGYMKNTTYHFDENGTMYTPAPKEGFYFENGGWYYYVDGKLNYAGLIWCDGPEGNDPGYYYVNSSCKLVTDCTYWISKNNGYMKNQNYTFDANGTMVQETGEGDQLLNGFVEENGELYYYVDGVKTYAGLILINGDYYYVNSKGRVIRDCTYWISKNNGYMKNGNYTFDETGKMIQN